MKSKLQYLLAFALLSSAAFASDATATFTFTDTTDTAFSGIAGKVKILVKFIFWIMYIVGGCLIGMAGFKLKEGDLKGFVKTLIGGGCVFISPFLIQALLSVAQGT